MDKIKMNKKLIISIILLLIIILGIIAFAIYQMTKGNKLENQKIDDWKFSSEKSGESFGTIKSETAQIMTDATSGSSNLGLSVGGAKDINNFRENIKNGYFPISTDITYNGLFYDYTFDTGNKSTSDQLFSPSYSIAVSKDPFSGEEEYYVTVGLNSNIKESDFVRKKLNLVIVLDISGSMGASFNSYYYDNPEKDIEDGNKSKMQIANESVNILIDQLKEDDRFGMVLFNDGAYLGKEITKVQDTDIDAIKNHILEIKQNGGTNFESGYKMATQLFDEYKNQNADEYENRIIVITDAMPNYGETSKDGLLSYVKENSKDGIYTSFIGVGVDFNSKLIQEISDVKGANYYSVHNSEEFKSRMGEQFDYMVTPLVFDLNLNMKSEDYEIASVYGSDTVNKENGSIMYVNTLFPSKTTNNGEVKGGVILLKLNKKSENTAGKLKLDVTYKDRNGKEYSNSQEVEIKSNGEDEYQNTGIRKAIVLTRYANVLKDWILYERTENDDYVILKETGILEYNYDEGKIKTILGENERKSVKLTVSEEYKSIFNQMKKYLQDEIMEINDENLMQELDILNELT